MLELPAFIDTLMVPLIVRVLATTPLSLPCPAIVNNDENICPTLASL